MLLQVLPRDPNRRKKGKTAGVLDQFQYTCSVVHLDKDRFEAVKNLYQRKNKAAELVEDVNPLATNEITDEPAKDDQSDATQDQHEEVFPAYPKLKVNSWQDEKDSFRGKAYRYLVREYPLKKVRVAGMDFTVESKVKDNRVDVFIEVSNEGSTHPHVFIKNALSSELARRLALRVEGQISDGRRFQTYPKSTRGKRIVQLANSFCAKLLGVAPEQEESVASTSKRQGD